MGKANWWDRRARLFDGDLSGLKVKKKAKKKLIKPVAVVYRYFDDPDYADAFASGEIFVSTLKRCREYEDPLQGDPEEAFEHYNSGSSITGHGSDKEFVARAARAGVFVDPSAENITIKDQVVTNYLSDAYVLCTTLGFAKNLSGTFGAYCVKITNPDAFSYELTKALAKDVRLFQSLRGPVAYRAREYRELEDAPGVLGFVKPPDLYASQREYRFLWTVVDGEEVSPRVVSCPNIVPFVKRVK
ncbi:hypothetical protein D3C81_405210 [compost metagenome]